MPKIVIGTDGPDTLFGDPGDTLVGGRGDDTYIIYDPTTVTNDLFDSGRGGYDRVLTFTSYDLRNASVEFLSTAVHAGTESINLTGNVAAQTIIGNYGDNIIVGGGGSDVLLGLFGDDTYFVRDATDRVIENVGEGFDRLFTPANFTLASDASIEFLGVSNPAGGLSAVLTGNRIAQIIRGGDRADVINGAGGADTLEGGLGDDVYLVLGQGETVTELATQGTDLLYTTASYVLGAGVAIETLSTAVHADTAAINLQGNEVSQTLIGNFGANVLDGRRGQAGDTLIGLAGDDTYRVYGVRDVVRESGGGGQDIVFTSGDHRLAASSEVETLSTVQHTATDAINLFGNELANVLIGNSGANLLDGGAAGDTLIGLAGADIFRFSSVPTGGVVDRVADYGVGADVIQLDSVAFGGLAVGALTAGALAYGAVAADADDRIVYDPATGALSFDADGNGAGVAIGFATLSGGIALADLRFTVAPTPVEGTVRVTTPGTFLIGNATGSGTSLATTFPSATGFIFGFPVSDGSQRFNLVFGPNTTSGSAPQIGFTDATAPGIFDFSQLDQGLVTRPDQGFFAANGTLLIGEPPIVPNISGIPPPAIIGTAFDDVIIRSPVTGNFVTVQTGRFSGGAGNDLLSGGSAMDGGPGDDRLIGELFSRLTGGAGADSFDLPIRTRQPGTNSQTAPNSVTDFDPLTDTIRLIRNITTDLAPGALDPSRFAIGAAATTPEHRIIYNPVSGELHYDANGSFGDLTGSILLFARLSPNLDLTVADFLIL
ncbi:beta strand repeat-containing protein [uncultured Sphingomonas sp.]|uniref:beta strand repeat-containing protein n=1 Tax=uncultured Sphingomonas sp. TaxID=158754 RepID=UPI0035CA92E5